MFNLNCKEWCHVRNWWHLWHLWFGQFKSLVTILLDRVYGSVWDSHDSSIRVLPGCAFINKKELQFMSQIDGGPTHEMPQEILDLLCPGWASKNPGWASKNPGWASKKPSLILFSALVQISKHRDVRPPQKNLSEPPGQLSPRLMGTILHKKIKSVKSMTKKPDDFRMITAPKGWNFSKGSPRLLTWPCPFFWPVKDLIHFDERVEQPQIPHKNRETFSLSEYIRVDELRGSACKKTVSFLPPIVLSELLFHWSMNYTANWVTKGYPTTSYKNQTKNHWWFVRILFRILGVIHGMNVRKVLFVAGHSSHCRLAGERKMVFERLWSVYASNRWYKQDIE